jgi:hypothetical protein
MGFGRGKSGKALPAQATIYRFLWALEKQDEALEKAMKDWAKAVLVAMGKPQSLLEVSLDAKHLKGSAGGGVGDKAIVLVSAYLGELGLSLLQNKNQADEAVQGRKLIMELGSDLAELGIPWVLTGDAAHTETQTAKTIVQKGVTISSRSKTIKLS